MVKDVTEFHKRHLGGRGKLEYVCVCVCVCVCMVSYRILSFRIWGTPKFGDMDGEYSI